MPPVNAPMSVSDAPPRFRWWREGNVRPVAGNSPNDRLLRGPDFESSQESLRRCLPRHSGTEASQNTAAPGMRFLRHGGIYRSDGGWQPRKTWGRGTASRWSAPGPVPGRDGRSTPCSSFAMSSGRLFLDRVARQQSPSSLHRHAQLNTHSPAHRTKDDISTLQRRRHFYFALTLNPGFLLW
jgi:hypothetical protein